MMEKTAPRLYYKPITLYTGFQPEKRIPNMPPSDKKTEQSDLVKQLVELVQYIPEDKQIYLLKILKEWKAQGKRAHDRKECLIPVDYSTKDRFFRDFIQDISAGGVFIETRDKFGVGQEIALTFSVPNSQIPFRVLGQVTRTSDQGIAVQFKKVTRYQEEILQFLLEKL